MNRPHAGSVSAIIPCNDIDQAERWWNRLGFFGPGNDGDAEYRILSDSDGATIHLQPAVPGWVVPGQNPFGVYLSTPRVDQLAEAMRDSILGADRTPGHTEWGMYEFALSGPDDLLVRIGWPSRLPREGEGDSTPPAMDVIST